ncbi:MAG: ABC transporter ATPase [Flavobacteriales bacterium]|nr:ABC transporter ATPase [Flavobacteriales bacterium]|tara:strand:+ start:8738 stop:9220 length:483 start_codon:yes stop_codon:yes gene_type:complete
MVQIINKLPDSSRVWVYQSNRAFSESELSDLKECLMHFNLSWEAHGKKLNSAIELYYNQFIVIFVDESFQDATGCSIDKSVALMKDIEAKFGVEMLDRMNLAYKQEESIKNIKIGDFQLKARSGEFDTNLVVFNNLVKNKGEFLANWETIAKKSWHINLF